MCYKISVIFYIAIWHWLQKYGREAEGSSSAGIHNGFVELYILVQDFSIKVTMESKFVVPNCTENNQMMSGECILYAHFVTWLNDNTAILTLRGKMKSQLYLPSQCIHTYIYWNKLLYVSWAAFTQGVFTGPLYMWMHTSEQWLPYSNTNVLYKTNTEQDIGTSNLNSVFLQLSFCPQSM